MKGKTYLGFALLLDSGYITVRIKDDCVRDTLLRLLGKLRQKF